MVRMKKPITIHLTNPKIWAVALIFASLLAIAGYMMDRKIQHNHFLHATAEIKAEINELLLTASSDVQKVQITEFEPLTYLTDLASESNITSSVVNFYLINEDGTLYGLNIGNPHQNFLATRDDTDYASTPLTVNQSELWQYYFLHKEALSPFLWPSPFSTDQWLITVSSFLQNSDTISVVAFEIPPAFVNSVHSTSNLAYQFKMNSPVTFNGAHPQLKYPLKTQITNQLSILGGWTFPWISVMSSMAAIILVFIYVALLNRRSTVKVISPWKDLQSTLCDELNVLLFETNSESEIIWVAGQLPEGTIFSGLATRQSIKAVLQEHPKYISYWQHSLAGEKLTYEIDNGRHCLRIHQWPLTTENGFVENIRVMVQDISDKRSLETQLQHQQLHDTLTGLPNRQVFIEQLNHNLHRAKRRQESVAVLAVEISGIGHINKQFGHKACDALLQKISQNIQGILRSEDTLCRFSNDEFLISFNDYHQQHELQAVAERIIDRATARMTIDGHEMGFFANVGIATYPRDALDKGSLVSNAITAMRHARMIGRNTLDYFSADNARVAQEKWQLEQDITTALNAHDFTLHYQPIFDLRTNKCIGAEALIRWPGTDLTPDQFIPLAEETGLIHNIGLWVLEVAISQFYKWNALGGEINYISINLSVIQLQDDDFLPKLDEILQRLPIENGRVVLELTESVMMNTSKEMLFKLQALRERGFYLAIDDFGTGFSSLNYLKHLPINYLKVDRSFVDGIPNNAHDTVICEAIIQMALAMNLQIIAEGVETPRQMSWLSSKGVLYAQGYFYAHAVSGEDFKPYIGIH